MKHSTLRKMVLTALFATLGYVLSTFVYFPQMAPFQHFVNVLAAVFVGPWYGLLAALLTGLMRMAFKRQHFAGGPLGPYSARFWSWAFVPLYQALLGRGRRRSHRHRHYKRPGGLPVYDLDLRAGLDLPVLLHPLFHPLVHDGRSIGFGRFNGLKKSKSAG